MAMSRRPAVAFALKVRAALTRQTPRSCERRVIAAVRAIAKGPSLSPRDAWRVYRESMARRCFTDLGWLVQYGVYSFTGPELFTFSLVRRLNTLETWNDDFFQVDLRVEHQPTEPLRRLGEWHCWSFDFPSPQAFADHCEPMAGVRTGLADTSAEWKWRVDCQET